MKRLKLLPSVLMLALCIGILGIGIYAATPTNNVITGTITVNAANAGITVEVFAGQEATGAALDAKTSRTETKINLGEIEIDASNALSLEDVGTKYYTIRFSTTSTHKFIVDTETIQLIDGTISESETKEDAIIITKNHKKYLEDDTTGLAYFTADTTVDDVTTDNSYVITIAIRLGELPEQAFGATFNMVFDVHKLEDWTGDGINGIDYLHFGEYPQSAASDVSADDLTADGVFYGYDDDTTSETAGGKIARSAYTDGTNRYVLYNSVYYKIEPLKWRILNQAADGTTMLMCDTIVERVYFQQFYDDSGTYAADSDGNILKEEGETEYAYANNYNVSTLRNYLIDTFYNGAFSTSEQVIIKSEEGQVDNSVDSQGDVYSSEEYACANTNDPVFAPSVAEVTNSTYGFGTDEESTDDTRKITASDYATATGVYSYNGSGCWWLRSPDCSDAYDARCVSDDGVVDFHDGGAGIDPGCVPALLLGL